MRFLVREGLARALLRPERRATRASPTSTFDVLQTRNLVHVRPFGTGHCHRVTVRLSRPISDSHLSGIEADMCIAGEYRLALIQLWLNGFPGCDVSCCPVRRSAARRGGTTSAASRVVRASTTPSTVTPPAAGMALASPRPSPNDSANSPTPPDSDRSDSTTYVTGRPASCSPPASPWPWSASDSDTARSRSPRTRTRTCSKASASKPPRPQPRWYRAQTAEPRMNPGQPRIALVTLVNRVSMQVTGWAARGSNPEPAD